MSDRSSAAIERPLRVYIGVFVALLAGTLLTVWAWTWHLDNMALTVAVAMFIASVKAFLVAGYFMHLISERRTIHVILLMTVFFFAGLMCLTLLSRSQLPVGTRFPASELSPLSQPGSGAR